MILEEFLRIHLVGYVKFQPEGKTFEDVIRLFLLGKVKAGWTSKSCKEYIKYFEAYVPRYKYKTWFLKDYGLKHCTNCDKVLPRKDFTVKKGKGDGLKSQCKICVVDTRLNNIEKAREYGREHYRDNKESYIFNARNREISKINRTPFWSQKDLIRNFYSNKPTGYHVDHIIPLQGKLVSGLHVIENLQYLSPKENASKGSKYEIE